MSDLAVTSQDTVLNKLVYNYNYYCCMWSFQWARWTPHQMTSREQTAAMSSSNQLITKHYEQATAGKQKDMWINTENDHLTQKRMIWSVKVSNTCFCFTPQYYTIKHWWIYIIR